MQDSLAHLSTPGWRWTYHLWFLVDLLVLSTLYAAAAAIGGWLRLGRLADRLADTALTRPVLSALAGLPLLGVYALIVVGSGKLLGEHRLMLLGIIDLHSALGHLPYFAAGALVHRRTDLLARFVRPCAVAWLGGIAAALALAAIAGEAGSTAKIAKGMLLPLAGLGMSHVLLSAAHRWINASSAVVREAVDSAFTVYLLHHPLIVLLGTAFLCVDIPPLAEFALIVVATTVISFAGAAAVRKSPALLFLLNGVVPKGRPAREWSAPRDLLLQPAALQP